MALAVAIDQVKVNPSRKIAPSLTAVHHMCIVLARQGQIEPLQVYPDEDGVLTTFPEDPWGDIIILAARELKWPTILIVEMARYEE